MVERKQLGLIFTVNPNWMGGTNYILNLINSFKYLDDAKRPKVILLCSDESDYQYARKYTDYPYLDYKIFYRKPNIFSRIVNKLSRTLFSKNIISSYNKSDLKQIDIIYPIYDKSLIVKGKVNIGWIPDFQEKYLPDFFSDEELKHRDDQAKGLRDSGIKIVFSSNDAKKDYIQFYNASEDKAAVFRFSSNIPVIDSDVDSILNKYNVNTNKFFFCSNQFWIHKNHWVLFKAISKLKAEGYNPLLLCTGNSMDFRVANYFEELSKFIEEKQLQDNIRILGLIERKEQIALMKNSMCIIQPSLFEGWNTSIEEAKAMNKFLIVSDLSVHKEQVSRNVLFFNRYSEEDLADKMKIVMNGEIKSEIYDYSISIKDSAESFIAILRECSESFRDSSRGN